VRLAEYFLNLEVEEVHGIDRAEHHSGIGTSAGTGDNDDVKVGTPCVAGAKVVAEVAAHGRGEKVKILKFRRRKHHMKQAGHRQAYTELKITGIQAG